MKAIFSNIVGVAASLVVACLASCGQSNIQTGDKAIFHETKFNSCYIDLQNEDLTNLGFAFGDSCNVYFTNGKSMLDVPYYDGYYTRSDFPLICGYQGYPYVQITVNNSSDFWDQYELDESLKANIVLNEKGKYLAEQEAFSMHYYNEREKYDSDEIFANFREITTSNIAKGVLYRGASPFNDNYCRARTVNKLLKEHGIKFILDLSDSEADIASYKTLYPEVFVDSYAIEQETVFLNMGSNFRLDIDGVEDEPEFDTLFAFEKSEYKENLVRGLNALILSEGPYYVHCVEGKDRTGFVCTLLEALCGASYEEMKNDYMVTYTNYFGLQPGEAKYEAVVKLRFDEFMEYLSGSTTDIQSLSYVSYAKAYLKAGGMSNEAITRLVERLTTPRA